MHCREYTSDESYVLDIRKGGAHLDRAIDCLYRTHREAVLSMVRGYLRSRSGIEDDAVDVCQDAFLIMIEKICGDGYNAGSLVHFWTGITKGLLRNKLKRDARTDLIEDSSHFDEENDASPEDILISGEKKAALDHLLSRLGGRCKQVLLMWAGGYLMEEIADATGLSSEAMARKTKYKCKKKLMKLLDSIDIDF